LLSSLSKKFWKAFSTEFGINPSYQETGHLFLSSTVKNLDSLFCTGLKNSLELKRFDKTQIKSIWPELLTLGTDFGVYCPDGGYLDHQKVIDGLLVGFQKSGGRLSNNIKASKLIKKNGEIKGVHTSSGIIYADQVINCSGANIEEITKIPGSTKYFKSRHHELIIATPKKPIYNQIPWLIDIDRQVHLRPNGKGQVLVGGFLGKDEEVCIDTYVPSTSKKWLIEVIKMAEQAFGVLGNNPKVLQHWGGLYPGTIDYLPIIEQTNPGLFTVGGFSGTGLMHAPAVGEIVSDLVLDGYTNIIDLKSFHSNRLNNVKLKIENTGF
jgi:sarcosine oxidase subunit beta